MKIFVKQRMLTNCILFFITLKLLVSPWSTGDYASYFGLILNYLCDVMLLLIALFNIKYELRYIYICSVIGGIAYFSSTAIYTEYNPLIMLTNHFKLYLPFLLYPVMLDCYTNDRKHFIFIIKRIMVSVLICLGMAVLTFPDSINRLETWWPSYFGGVHTTSYISFMVLALGIILYLKNMLSKNVMFCMVSVLSFSIYFGWGVRTATIATLIFVFGTYINRIQFYGKLLKGYILLVASFIIGIFVPILSLFYSMNEVSSGRLYMYQEKYKQLIENNFLQWVIGNGYGSDLIETDFWWWEAKGAHSDIITFLVEGGSIYLICFIFVFYNMMRTGKWVFKSLLVASFFTSTVSNGIFVRPIAGYLLIICLTILSQDSCKESISRDK